MILHVHKDRTDDLNLTEVANEFVSVKKKTEKSSVWKLCTRRVICDVNNLFMFWHYLVSYPVIFMKKYTRTFLFISAAE